MSSPVGVHRTLGGGEVDFDILILALVFITTKVEV